MGLGSGSRDRVIVELGLEERPGARVLSGSRASTHLQCLGQAWCGRQSKQSILLLWHMGTGGILGTAEELWACPSNEQSICLWFACCVYFVLCGCLHQRAVREGRWAACFVYGLVRAWLF